MEQMQNVATYTSEFLFLSSIILPESITSFPLLSFLRDVKILEAQLSSLEICCTSFKPRHRESQLLFNVVEKFTHFAIEAIKLELQISSFVNYLQMLESAQDQWYSYLTIFHLKLPIAYRRQEVQFPSYCVQAC